MTTSPGLGGRKKKKTLEVSLCLSDHSHCWHHVCSHGNITVHTGMNTSTQRWQQLKLDRYDPYLLQDSLLWLDFFQWGGKILAQSFVFEASDGRQLFTVWIFWVFFCSEILLGFSAQTESLSSCHYRRRDAV